MILVILILLFPHTPDRFSWQLNLDLKLDEQELIWKSQWKWWEIKCREIEGNSCCHSSRFGINQETEEISINHKTRFNIILCSLFHTHTHTHRVCSHIRGLTEFCLKIAAVQVLFALSWCEVFLWAAAMSFQLLSWCGMLNNVYS